MIDRRGKHAALILDMDGVIVDTEPIHVDSFRVFLKRRDIIAPEDFLLGLIGHSVEENVREIHRTFFKQEVPDLKREVREREAIYLELLQERGISPQPGLEHLIGFCQKTRIDLALASSSIREQIQVILEKLTEAPGTIYDYHGIFSVIVSGEDVDCKKPAPDIYLLALAQLGVDRSRCMAVEDSPAGIESAKSAGLKCLAARTGYIDAEKLSAADGIIDTLNEVPDMMSKFNLIIDGV
jgi:beta-phosphoglucomutase-like phosphatase (HAD superfamily)